MKKLHVILLFFGFYVSFVHANEPLYFFSKTVQDGLSHNTVLSIYKDHKGLIWIGTSNGLNVYTGNNFIQYNNNITDSTTIANNVIWDIFESKDSTLYFCTEQGISMLNRYDYTFSTLWSNQKYSQIKYRAIEQSSDGVLWCASLEYGVFSYNPHNDSFTHYPQLYTDSTNNHAFALLNDGKYIWVGLNNGVAKISIATHKAERIVSGCVVSSLGIIGNTLFIGTFDKGLLLYDTKLKTLSPNNTYYNLTQTCTNKAIHAIKTYKETVWIGTNYYLLSYNTSTQSIQEHAPSATHKNSINNREIRSLYIDNDSTLWIGIYNGGINWATLTQKFFKNYSTKVKATEFAQNSVFALAFENEHTLWVGIDGDGLQQHNLKTGTIKHFQKNNTPQSLSGNEIIALAFADSSHLWYGTWGLGYGMIDTKNHSITRYGMPNMPYKIPSGNVYDILKAKDSSLWLATIGGGAARINTHTYEKDIFTNIPSDSSSIADNVVWCIFEDSKRRIWLGTHSGLCLYNPINKNFTTYNSASTKYALTSNWIISIAEDIHGNLWIGTHGGGLHKFNPETNIIKSYSEKNGLPSKLINFIITDANNAMWIGTNSGLALWNPTLETCVNYSISDGLQDMQLQTAAYNRWNNTIAIGGLKGFTIFNPDSVYIQATKKPILFTQAFSNNSEIIPAQKSIDTHIFGAKAITLPYSNSHITLQFSSLDFIHADKYVYAYRLLPNEEWIRLGNQKTIQFANLSPQKYTLCIRGDFDYNFKNPIEQTILLTILPPWWAQWWFKITIITILIIVIVTLYRYKTATITQRNVILESAVQEKTISLQEAQKKLERTNQELKLQNNTLIQQSDKLQESYEILEKTNQTKDTLFQIVAHDIKNPFFGLLGFAEILHLQYDALPKKEIKQYINHIFSSSNTIYSLVSQLFDWAKSQSKDFNTQLQHIQLLPIITEIIELMTPLLLEKQIAVECTIVPNTIVYTDTHILQTVCRNILHNAIKHSPIGERIIINSHEEGNAIFVSIQDFGKGIEHNDIQKIMRGETIVSTKDTLQRKGTGLGLAICKEFLHKIQETLIIQSKNPIGTTVLFSLQKGNSKEVILLEPQNKKETSLTLADDFKFKKILIVEDNLEIRKHLTTTLSKYYTIIEAANGKIALEKIKTQKPDCIVSDIQMPYIDGITLSKKLRSQQQYDDVPIILLTALSYESSFIDALDAGADDFIRKPFNAEHLAYKIMTMLNTRKKISDKKNSTQSILDIIENPETNEEVFIQKLQEIVTENIGNNDFSVEQLAAEISLSRTQLYRKTKQLFSITPVDYIKNMRLSYAAKLLKTGNYRVSEVAYITGFSDPNYFSSCFSHYFNSSPSEYSKKSDT